MNETKLINDEDDIYKIRIKSERTNMRAMERDPRRIGRYPSRNIRVTDKDIKPFED